MIKRKTNKAGNGPVQSEAELEAVEWFRIVNLDDSPTEEQLVAYIKWLEQSPHHEELIAGCESAWELMADLESDEEITAYMDESLSSTASQPARYLDRLLWGTAASMVLVALLLVASVTDYFDLILGADTFSQTVTGQQKEVTLGDGSVVTLNTATEVHWEFGKEYRHVFLERGEALFDVVNDTERPFIVFAGSGEVRALGTLFNVRMRDSDVVVSLLEGKVAVETATHRNPAHQRVVQDLSPGEQARYTQEGVIDEIKQIDVKEVTQWQQRKLSFSDIPLSEIVAEVNRYTTVKLVVDDSSLLNERLSAYFLLDNMDSFLNAIENFFDIEATEQSGKILLSRAEKQKTGKG